MYTITILIHTTRTFICTVRSFIHTIKTLFAPLELIIAELAWGAWWAKLSILFLSWLGFETLTCAVLAVQHANH